MTIGITGHRILAEVEKLEAALDEVAHRLEDAFPEEWTVISALAEGADRLAARRLLARGKTRLVAVLPLARQDYETDFETPGSRIEFADLLDNADYVMEIPSELHRDEAYEVAGQAVLEGADVLVAVWDGKIPQGRGGTGGIVAEARERKMPLAWVHAGNRKLGSIESTTLGEEQGAVTFECFPEVPEGTARMSQDPSPDPHSTMTISGAPDGERRKRRAERRAHVRHIKQDAQWWVIGVSAAVATILGMVGFRQYLPAQGNPAGFGDAAYLTLQLFTLDFVAADGGQHMPLSLQVARFLAPAVMAGALVRATLGLFRDQTQLLRLRIIRDHVVICGVGRAGFALARSLREQGYRVVAIDQDAESNMVASCRSVGVPVLIGDATDIDVLRKAGVTRAAFIVALCGESGTNAQIAVIADRLAKGRRRSLTCLAQVLEPDLCSLLRTKFPAAEGHTAFRLEFFDIYERAARVLLQRHPAFGDVNPPAGIEASKRPHLLIIGFGRLGQSLVLQAARNWKSAQQDTDQELLITVIDPRAAQEVRACRARHPEMNAVCRIQPTDAYDEHEAQQVTVAYVCLGNDAEALQAGLAIYEKLQDQGTTVVIRGRTQEGLPALLHGSPGRHIGLHGFALLDQTCDADLLFGGLNEAFAQLLHARYLRIREAQGWSFGPQRDVAQRTNPALASWPALDEDYKDSNRDQAAHILNKLAAVRCKLVDLVDWDAKPISFGDDEIEQLARLEHERWMDRERHKGRFLWVPGRRRHPDLRPWEQLTAQEQDIDREFVRELPRLLAQLGYRIVRRPS